MTTEAIRLYDALAPIYDEWQSADDMTPFALVALAKLEPALARWGRGRVQSFADVGCGTGELLLALRRAHPDWRLAGTDVSAAMLGVAARKPHAGGVAWIRAPLDGPLPLAGPFDAAGAFYDTLNHLLDAAALARAVAAAAAALRPGGLFIFDLTNALGFERWWNGRNRWSGEGWSIAIETSYDPPARTGRALVTIGRGQTSAAFPLVERYFSDDEVRAALGGAGLAVLAAEPWSPFALDAPGKTLWITAKSPSDEP
jgi:SAM-dependent methyltransferase